jgi:hypothetical protein
MKTWFCVTEQGLPVTIKIGINTAGYLIKKNNPALITRILPVAEGIKQTIDTGTDNAAMNAILAEAIGELTGHIAGDPVIEAAISATLSQLKIDVVDKKVAPFAFSNEVLKDIIDSFVAGLSMPIAK